MLAQAPWRPTGCRHRPHEIVANVAPETIWTGNAQYAPRHQPFKALRDDARLAAGISEDQHRSDFAIVDWTPAPRLRPMGED